jgi:hypothetical protein
VDPVLGGRDAYGAKVVAIAGGKRLERVVQPASSYMSSDEPVVHFGLGSATQVTGFEVRWPDGDQEVERFPGGPVDRKITLRRREGKR